ncbi:hypothetical protein I6H48_06875 [Corynebacterium amycolatum]|uniref:Uncharacterized protein n=1 Tax=Corynebacterium amycolatum TaxID=43765 RepID=A0A7T4G811_CORAY|nr:hypothetical protein [Corynebacterium amycolatum]QQB83999.1 hypothetical protein I6H48_06875 [Corynebacterium amycolatum]
MKPTIIDADTGHELWTAVEYAAFSGTARGTFTSYAGLSDKMCVCYRRVAGLDVAFLDAD